MQDHEMLRYYQLLHEAARRESDLLESQFLLKYSALAPWRGSDLNQFVRKQAGRHARFLDALATVARKHQLRERVTEVVMVKLQEIAPGIALKMTVVKEYLAGPSPPEMGDGV